MGKDFGEKMTQLEEMSQYGKNGHTQLCQDENTPTWGINYWDKMSQTWVG